MFTSFLTVPEFSSYKRGNPEHPRAGAFSYRATLYASYLVRGQVLRGHMQIVLLTFHSHNPLVNVTDNYGLCYSGSLGHPYPIDV